MFDLFFIYKKINTNIKESSTTPLNHTLIYSSLKYVSHLEIVGCSRISYIGENFELVNKYQIKNQIIKKECDLQCSYFVKRLTKNKQMKMFSMQNKY